MKIKPLYCLTLTALVSLAACNNPNSKSTEGESADSATTEQVTAVTEKIAVAQVNPLGEGGISGTVTFTEKDGKVHMVADITSPEKGHMHAIHIHEYGDCNSPDGKSAGGHWNPTGEDHGEWGKVPFHRGDIGNIEVGEDGKDHIELTTDLWAIGGDDSTKNILGKAIIVHAMADDMHSQPSGAAGARKGCGIIQMQ